MVMVGNSSRAGPLVLLIESSAVGFSAETIEPPADAAVYQFTT